MPTEQYLQHVRVECWDGHENRVADCYTSQMVADFLWGIIQSAGPYRVGGVGEVKVFPYWTTVYR